MPTSSPHGAAGGPGSGPNLEPPLPVLVVCGDRHRKTTLTKALGEAGFPPATPAGGRTPPGIVVYDSVDAVASGAGLSRLRKTLPGVPVLFLTTERNFDNLLASDTFPGDDYLMVPFSADNVASRLRWLTRRGSAVHLDRAIRVGDVTLMSKRMQVERNGRTIPLTKTQCAVLRLLMLNPGTVLHKEEIARQIWPDNPDRGGSNVELYISYLRRKLSKAGPPVIRTVRGAGYVMNPGND